MEAEEGRHLVQGYKVGGGQLGVNQLVLLATQLVCLTVYHMSLPPSQRTFHRYTSGKVS